MLRHVLVVCVCAIWVASGNDVKGGDKTTLKAIAQSNLNFTSALYTQLSNEPGNVFFSPLSVHMILSLASLGAKGATALQMKRGLSLPSDDEVTKDGYHKLSASLKRNDNILLKIANKVYTDAQFELKPEFVTLAQSTFNADAAVVDFQHDVESARQKINEWVEQQTNSKIKDLFAEGALTPDTKMVLTNAIYFKAKWASPFNVSKTSTQPFHVTETETKDVEMMHTTGEFFYKKCKEINAQVLELPYIDHKLSLVIILPVKRNGLAEVEQKLKEVPLSSITKHLRLPEVIVALPKFKMEKGLEINDALKKMGMTEMFNSAANFSGITSTEVYVDKVVHKAFIEVNEEGSEAAAATGFGIVAMSMPDLPVQFNANHPFIFMIRHRMGALSHSNPGPGPVLFMGRYSGPPNEGA